jgi:tetratricopeptide (TPR) repeat protein
MLKFTPHLPAVLLGTAIATLIQPQAAYSALSAPEINKIAKGVTILIDGQNPGSGVLIQRQGNTYTVLTANHVVGTPDQYEIITPDGQRYALNYSTVKKLPGIDLATLEFTSSQSYPLATFGNSVSVSEGTTIYVSGFPMRTAALTESIYTFTRGEVTANASRALADGYALVYSNPTLPGMSGGPVLDGEGKLIGIHGRADGQQEVRQTESVYLKTGFNLGIPINTFISLNSSGSKVATTSPPATAQPTAGDFFLQATEKYQKGDFKGAIADLSQSIQLNPKNAEAYSYRGIASYYVANFFGAIKDLNQAIALNPQQADAYYNRGVIRVNSKQPGEEVVGIRDLEQAATLFQQQGKLADAARSRGLALSSRKDERGAIAAFSESIKLNPNDPRSFINRGNSYNRVGDFRAAIADFDAALRLSPKLSLIYFNRGTLHLRLGNLPSALVDFDRAIGLNPNYLDAYNNRGILRGQMKNFPGAIADFDRAIGLNPGDPQPYNNRGIAKREQGNLRGAMLDFDQAIRLNIRYASAYYNRGLARDRLGDRQNAIVDLQKAADFARSTGNMAVYNDATTTLRTWQR